MRRLTAGVAALAAATTMTLVGASPASAEEAPPPEPEGGVLVNVTIDGVTPICVNVVSISAFGEQLIYIPKTCVAG